MTAFMKLENFLGILTNSPSVTMIDSFLIDDQYCVCLSVVEESWEENLLLSKLEFKELLSFEANNSKFAIIQLLINNESQPEITNILTPRELQIATLVALGYVNKQIAKQLNISEWTVSTYIRRIFGKLGVESRAAMVYICYPMIKQLSLQLSSSCYVLKEKYQES